MDGGRHTGVNHAGTRCIEYSVAVMIDRSDANKQKRLMHGFFQIMHLWGVDDRETMRRLLGSPPERVFYTWQYGSFPRLAEDTVLRIGYVAGIYKALQILYSDAQQADEWVQQPNRYFGGQTPIERMASGDVADLAAVRSYVDAARAP
jgi:antitoxin Xre/MbcA/ParS-like protein